MFRRSPEPRSPLRLNTRSIALMPTSACHANAGEAVGRESWSVADLAVLARLPLFDLVGPKRKLATGLNRSARRLRFRGSRSVGGRL